MGPLLKATLQGAVVSAISNILGQLVDARRASVSPTTPQPMRSSPPAQRPFALNCIDLARFVCLHLLTAPPNYKWQELLERNFPARGPDASHSPVPLKDRDIEKNSEHGHGSGDKPPPLASRWRARGPGRRHGRLNYRNTITKWFIDCITLGALMNTTAFLVITGYMKGQSWDKIAHNLRTQLVPIIVNGYKLWPIASILSFSFIPVERRILFFSCVGLCWNVYLTLVSARL